LVHDNLPITQQTAKKIAVCEVDNVFSLSTRRSDEELRAEMNENNVFWPQPWHKMPNYLSWKRRLWKLCLIVYIISINPCVELRKDVEEHFTDNICLYIYCRRLHSFIPKQTTVSPMFMPSSNAEIYLCSFYQMEKVRWLERKRHGAN